MSGNGPRGTGNATRSGDEDQRDDSSTAGATRPSVLRRCIVGFGRAVRTGWLVIGVLVLLLAGVELASAVIYKTARMVKYRARLDPRLTSPIYAKADWAVAYFGNELKASQEMRWEPYVYWRRKPFAGNLINVDDRGYRRTLNPAPADAPVRVLCLGGSTMWGTGVRDAYTLPSLIARNLAERGIRHVYVENLGESGYVSTQELILLQLRLRAGDVPDIAVFHDGANDLFAAFQNGVAGLPQNECNRGDKFKIEPGRLLHMLVTKTYTMKGMDKARSILRRRRSTPPAQAPPPLPANDTALVRQAVHTYFANVRLIRALAREYGFKPVFIWQPLLPYKRPLGESEQNICRQLGKQATFYKEGNAEFQRVYPRAGISCMHDFSDMFDGQTQDVFFDFCHTSETGNQQIANRMTELIVPLLPQVGAQKRAATRRTRPSTTRPTRDVSPLRR